MQTQGEPPQIRPHNVNDYEMHTTLPTFKVE